MRSRLPRSPRLRWRHRLDRAALGRRDHQSRRQLPRLRRARAGSGGPLAGPDQGRRGRGQRRARHARRRPRRADRRRRQGGRRGRARRPVPGRRLPDRLRHLLEHERQRGDRQPRRRRRAPQRPRQHGPVLQRRLPLRRPPGGARRGDARPAAGDGRAAVGAGGEGDASSPTSSRRSHPPDGRGPGHPRPGVRRLRGAGPARGPAGRGDAAPGRPDPARRHRHRHRAQHPPRVRRQGPRAARRRHRPGDLRAARPASRRRATATPWSSSRARSRSTPSRSTRSPTTWR